MELDINKSMERCVEDAESHVIEQDGFGFFLHGISASTPKIGYPDRRAFVKVIAEIIWAERNGARRPRTE